MVSFSIVNVYPPAPLKPVKVTLPGKHEYIGVPSVAAMSIPEWDEDAPDVGEVLFPKGEVMLWFPGRGQLNRLEETGMYSCSELYGYLIIKIDMKISINVRSEKYFRNELNIELTFLNEIKKDSYFSV